MNDDKYLIKAPGPAVAEPPTAAPLRGPTPEQAVQMLSRPIQIGKPRKSPTSKQCQCGRVISANAAACQKCVLEGIDKALRQVDADMTRAAGAGDFTKAKEAGDALTKLQAMKEGVRKGFQKIGAMRG